MTNHLVEGIKVIKHILPNHKSIEIYSIADVHWEAPETTQDRFLKFVQYILEKPNRYVVLNGDLLDMALTLSVSDTYGSTEAPSSAVTTFATIIQMLKDRILAVNPGNHEDRVYKYTGIDVTEYLLLKAGLDLGIYAKNSFVLILQFGMDKNRQPIKYSGYFHHGFGGGRMKGGKVNNNIRLSEIVDVDFYSNGHVHDPNATGTKKFLIDFINDTVKEFKQYFMITNAWQETGGYGLKHGFRPTLPDIFYYELDGSRKAIQMHTLDFNEEDYAIGRQTV